MPKDETMQQSVSGAFIEMRTISIHTGNTCEEDEWNNHHGEPAAPNDPGSPDDNGVAYNILEKWLQV
jgi:hypothetical protein